jgi:hypothetical protein
MEGFGVIQTEENGILNLNRYLPLSETEGRLVREIEVQTGDKFTFSRGLDELTQINLDQLTVAVRQISDRCSHTRQHDWRGFLELDFDLSALPCGKQDVGQLVDLPDGRLVQWSRRGK